METVIGKDPPVTSRSRIEVSDVVRQTYLDGSQRPSMGGPIAEMDYSVCVE